LFCIITTLNLIQQQQPLKWYKNWNSSFFPTQHTVQTLSHLITIFWDHSKMCYIGINLQTMKNLRTWCIHGFMHDQKHSFQMA
jgi:hypothetical protein